MVFGALSARECGGSSICEHGRYALVQGVRWGIKSASTVVYALSARSAVGDQSASTVVGALSAGSAVGDQSASTVVNALVALYVTHMDTRYAHDEIDDIQLQGLKILQVHWKIFV